MIDSELLKQFEEATLPLCEWTHRAHVRVAYLVTRHGTFSDVLTRLRELIKAYNAAHEIPEAVDRGYHETITVAFVRLIFDAIRNVPVDASSDEFCDSHPELLDKKVLLRFYSRERILSEIAKRQFVEPDLAELPIAPESGMS